MSDFPQRIVLVDDEPDIRRIVRESLERTRRDLALVTCSGGEELLTRLRELQPDLILLDLKMKKVSGPDILAKLRRRPEAKEVPIIFITGTRVEMTDDYKNLGVIGVIHKPFAIADLPGQIAVLWAEHKGIGSADSEKDSTIPG